MPAFVVAFVSVAWYVDALHAREVARVVARAKARRVK